MGLKKVLGGTLADFCSKTSIAGINNVVNRDSYLKKAYWLSLFIGGCFLTFQGLIDTFINYFEREVTTSTDLTHMPSVIFPAVSICNLNR